MTAGLPLKVRMASGFGTPAILALCRTVRFVVHEAQEIIQLREEGQRVIYAFWHGRLLPLVFRHRDRGSVVLVSQHNDGEIIARVLEGLGYVTARGSTTRGGAKGLRDLVRRASEGRDIGITPDGPRGPRGVAQPGVITAARLTGLPIVPIGAACARAWHLESWDRFCVPKPFSTVHLRYGPPLWVGDDADKDDSSLAFLQAQLDELTEVTARSAGLDRTSSPPPSARKA